MAHQRRQAWGVGGDQLKEAWVVGGDQVKVGVAGGRAGIDYEEGRLRGEKRGALNGV